MRFVKIPAILSTVTVTDLCCIRKRIFKRHWVLE